MARAHGGIISSERFGEGLHHIAFGVSDVQEAVAYLEENGGTHVLGAPDFPVALVDLKPLLGFTAELNQMPDATPPQAAPAQGSTNFGSNPMSHIGIFVPDVERSAQLLGDLMGVGVPAAVEPTGLQFPPDFEGDRDAHPKIISFRPEGIGFRSSSPSHRAGQVRGGTTSTGSDRRCTIWRSVSAV